MREIKERRRREGIKRIRDKTNIYIWNTCDKQNHAKSKVDPQKFPEYIKKVSFV